MGSMLAQQTYARYLTHYRRLPAGLEQNTKTLSPSAISTPACTKHLFTHDNPVNSRLDLIVSLILLNAAYTVRVKLHVTIHKLTL